MVNIDDFIKRLEFILDYYGLNASSFADKIGVQRSSMSHLLSGRNKPSLDFVMKILEVFPEVDLYWILNGIGDFPKKEKIVTSKKENYLEINKPIVTLSSDDNLDVQDLFSEIDTDEKKMNPLSNNVENKLTNSGKIEDEIERIVLFYKNGTFKVYIP
ncbi:helix-turn-helix transcriptional regulator [Flavobacterium sp.]|uniref:helix-turn-helix domain-containing protein n=1 Tax=Flavobacterium sp. TaxID=239 RepID=UPI00326750B9